MSPNTARMEQALVSYQQGDTAEVISSSLEAQEVVESSLDPEESVMIASLMQRIRQYGRASR